MGNLVETVDLKKYFKVGNGRFLHAVDGVNLEIPEGKTLGVGDNHVEEDRKSVV